MVMNRCPKCDGSEIDSGWILSAGKIAYKSDTQRYPFSGGNCRTYVCIDCGFVESYVDSEYLAKIKAKVDSRRSLVRN
jgi:hypothetical protein